MNAEKTPQEQAIALGWFRQSNGHEKWWTDASGHYWYVYEDEAADLRRALASALVPARHLLAALADASNLRDFADRAAAYHFGAPWTPESSEDLLGRICADRTEAQVAPRDLACAKEEIAALETKIAGYEDHVSTYDNAWIALERGEPGPKAVADMQARVAELEQENAKMRALCLHEQYGDERRSSFTADDWRSMTIEYMPAKVRDYPAGFAAQVFDNCWYVFVPWRAQWLHTGTEGGHEGRMLADIVLCSEERIDWEEIDWVSDAHAEAAGDLLNSLGGRFNAESLPAVLAAVRGVGK